MIRKRWLAILTLLAAGWTLAGCGGSGVDSKTDGNSAANPSNEPITLVFYTAQNSVYALEEGFEKEIGRFIKAKFPHITVEHIHRGTGTQYADLITAGKIPDIILESTANINGAIVNNGLQFDLQDLIKKNNYDLNRIDPAVVAQLKGLDGKIYGLPFTLSNFVTFYNKDLFDKYGVPPLRDGMTYDEVYELAKRLTRQENGTDYKGFSAHPTLMLLWNQMSLSPLNPKEDKAALNTDKWKVLVENFKRFYEIPGNAYSNVDDFPKDVIAIAIHVSEKIVSWYEANKQLNFDLASPPSLKEAPNTRFQPNTYALFISQQSKHKEQAFQVVAHLLSDEVQTELSKQGVVTPLTSKAVHQVFGQNLPHMKGKNTQAVFYSKMAFPPAPRPANLVSYSVPLGRVFDLILKEGQDVNSALRTVEEESNQKIAELKAAQGGK
jgi:multiple sugar transport system substrate-binding protein